MITRVHRFHGYSSLRFVYRNGQTIRGTQAALKYIRNDRQRTWRLAVVVSRKVSKSAVVRNRIRRRIYEIVRLQQDSISLPYDIVVLVFSPQLTELEPDRLTNLILELFVKAGIIGVKSTPRIEGRDTTVIAEEK